MKPYLLSLLMAMAVGLSAQTQQAVTSSQPNQAAPFTLPQPNPPGCGTDILHRIRMQSPLYAQQHLQMNNRIYNATNQGVERGAVRTIPVVVHIIHNNGPENISNQQVLTAIADLNQAFANNGGYTNPTGVNTNIQFCLAKQDPNGDYTTGINRVASPLTVMTSEVNDLELKDLIRWDPTRYLNIWVVSEINSLTMGSGIAGYAYFPNAHGQPMDGIVCEAVFMGANQNNSKVLVHEVGHYLGLYHTFEGGCGNSNCQLDGDRVCDTPPDNSQAVVNCSNVANTCSSDEDDTSPNNPFRPIAFGGVGGQNDMIEDYMDYGYQFCQKWFTQGQADRMNAALTTSRASLLQSIACQDICNAPVSTVFTISTDTVYTGDNVTFTITNPTFGATYTWYVDGVWAGAGTTITHLFPLVGLYNVSVTGTNGLVECASEDERGIRVICRAQALYSINTPGPYAPGATISLTNQSVNAATYTWYLDGVQVNNNTNFSQQFNAPGGHNVYLTAVNGVCVDTSATFFFTIGNCNISGMNNNWVFNNLSFNFSNGEPTVGGSPINTGGQESTTTISDPNGNLLFFSDGIQVWDRNHQLMPNGTGLMGSWSTTQSCLATPFPGNPNLYYLFTADAVENNCEDGIRYSIIDMTLNNGLGDVVQGSKNILIRNDVGEMLSGTFHANGRDIWIVMAKKQGNTYFTYLLTPQGISQQPVTSQVGTGYTQNGLGPVKFSPDGNKMASTSLGGMVWSIILADFNKTTGQFTNGMNIWLSTVVNQQPHSFEFSPDNSKLYVNHWQAGQIWQYNLAAGSINDIIASKYVVGPYTPPVIYGQLCRANNGKIYTYATWSGKMDFIANPNLPGAACQYTTGTINGYINGNSSFSIPNMLQGFGEVYIPSIAGKTNLCIGESTTYNVPYLTNDQSVAWTYTGNGTLTVNADETATLTNHSGTGQLIAVVTGNCGITRDTIQIQNVAAQQVSLGNDTTICGSELILFATPSNLATYLWNTNAVGTGIYITQPGTYWVKTTDSNGCEDRDTIVVTTGGNLALDLGPDLTSCNGATVTLDAGPGFTGYLWQDGSDNPTYTTTTPGTYWVQVSNGCATGHDTVVISGSTINFELLFNNDTIACKNTLPFTLTAPAGYQQYFWQNGNGSQSNLVSSVGTYWVRVTDSNGCQGTDTFRVVDCTSIDEVALQNIKVYPNPANHALTIGNLSPNTSYYIALYNTAGQLVAQPAHNKKQELVVDVNALAPGLYLYRITAQNGQSIMGRFVKE